MIDSIMTLILALQKTHLRQRPLKKHPKGLLDTQGPAEQGRIPSSSVFRTVRKNGMSVWCLISPGVVKHTKVTNQK